MASRQNAAPDDAPDLDVCVNQLWTHSPAVATVGAVKCQQCPQYLTGRQRVVHPGNTVTTHDSWSVPREHVHPLMWSPPGPGLLLSGAKQRICGGLVCSDACWKSFCEEKLALVQPFFAGTRSRSHALDVFIQDKLPSLLARDAYASPSRLAADLKAMLSQEAESGRDLY